MITSVGPTHQEWMSVQLKQKTDFAKLMMPQFENHLLHWGCPSDLYTTLTMKNWDTTKCVQLDTNKSDTRVHKSIL
jgi:hypothetical protein